MFESDEERKKKYGKLAEALKKKYGESDKGRIVKVLEEKGSKGLPDREIKKKRSIFD